MHNKRKHADSEFIKLAYPSNFANGAASYLFYLLQHNEAVQLFWEMKKMQAVPVATHNDLISLLAKHNLPKVRCFSYNMHHKAAKNI